MHCAACFLKAVPTAQAGAVTGDNSEPGFAFEIERGHREKWLLARSALFG